MLACPAPVSQASCISPPSAHVRQVGRVAVDGENDRTVAAKRFNKSCGGLHRTVAIARQWAKAGFGKTALKIDDQQGQIFTRVERPVKAALDVIRIFHVNYRRLGRKRAISGKAIKIRVQSSSIPTKGNAPRMI